MGAEEEGDHDNLLGGFRMSPTDVAGKLAHRGRGLDKLEERAGPVCRQIETRLIGAKRKLRLLEVGCGYGVALMQLRHRFRDRVELMGTNREESHGNRDAMLTAALLCDVSAVADVQSVTLPTITYCDAADGLPFDDRSFDLVVSQMCVQYITDKILLLREAARVLRDDGIAMIHTPLNRPTIPAPYALLLEIWDQGVPAALCEYVASGKGHECLQLGYHSCVHLSHCKDFGSDLDLVYAIQLNRISPAWTGVKSIYRRSH
jgi:ubiquinone/menaquinone biosynthesis C-methylase UbiE